MANGNKLMSNFVAILMLLNAFLVLFSFSVAAEDVGTPVIWTDKADYPPNSIVTFFGENWTAYDKIEIKIVRPNDSVQWANTTADYTGSFVSYYDLNGVVGLYHVYATDEHDNQAYTNFTDGKPPELSGWDWKFDDYTKSTLEGYGSGDWVWWRIQLFGAVAGDYNMVWNHDYYNKLIGAYGFTEMQDVRLTNASYPSEVDTGIVVTVNGPSYPEDSNTILMQFEANFTIVDTGDYYLTWDAKIDPNETKTWPGKALHSF